MNAGNFGKNLKDCIEFIGWSQATLSKKSGLTVAAISQIINNKREPSLSSVVKLLKATNIPFDRLVK